MYRFDGSTVLVIHIDVTHTVTHQTTHILPPAGTQNALDESHKKASAQLPHSKCSKCKPLVGQACSLDVGERMAHALDGGDRNNLTQAQPNLTTRNNLTQKARFSSWALWLQHIPSDGQAGVSVRHYAPLIRVPPVGASPALKRHQRCEKSLSLQRSPRTTRWGARQREGTVSSKSKASRFLKRKKEKKQAKGGG